MSELPGTTQTDERDSAEHSPLRIEHILDDLQALAEPIGNLVEAPGNPRRGDVDAIARSYRVFGQRKPIVVRRTGVDEHGDPVGIVEAGNHALRAARDVLGWTHLAVVWVEEDETTGAAYGLADNRVAELGDYDRELLAAELQRVAAGDDELLAAAAYSLDDLAALLGDDERHEVETEPISWGVFELDAVVDAAFEHYREHGMPVRALSVHESMQEVNQLAALDGHKLTESTLGYAVADTYHPHRFEARCEKRATVVEVFERDEYLVHALRLLAAQGRPITDSSLLQVLPYLRGAQAPSNFRPGFALSMYRRFAFEGADVLDTSTGYGGRLVGFLASSCHRYIGIDPDTRTYAANVRMAEHLCREPQSVVLINEPAEDVTLTPESVDFAFTSPPYFAKERYSDEATQSCNRYPSGESWREGFLEPVLKLQYDALRSGGMAVVNIADVKIGPRTFPLMDWTVEAAARAGFMVERSERFMLGGRVPGQGEKREAWEPLLIFRKPLVGLPD